MSFTLPAPVVSLAGHRAHFLATLYKITRRDGTSFLFTSHDSQVEFDDGGGLETYSPAGGFDVSALRRETGLDEQERSTRGAVSSTAITHEDLAAGLFSEAEVVEFLVDPRFPWAGTYWTLRYWIGDVEYDGETWEAEIFGVTNWLSMKTGRVHGRDCDADLFDSRCKVSTSAETWFEITGAEVQAGTIDASDPRRKFGIVFSDIPTVGPEEDEYKHGRIVWTLGANAGVTSEIKEHGQTSTPSQRDIELALPTPYAIADGDEGTLRSGCDRLRSTCIRKFSNLPNGRFFPFMPGADDAFETPNAPNQ